MNTVFDKNICIVGAGYVGLATAAHLMEVDGRKNPITVVDINESKLEDIRSHKFLIGEEALRNVLYSDKANDAIIYSSKLPESDIYIVAINTNYNKDTGNLDTTGIESLISEINEFKNKLVIIKSTIPVGFTDKVIAANPDTKIVFIPEFLRENNSYYDTKTPSRFIIGSYYDTDDIVVDIPELFGYTDNNPIYMTPSEAELVKLASNTYLALRVDFFNEISMYCINKGYDSSKVIEGISRDPRIGTSYNNPSFGYGGYCLPKDSAQMANLANSKLLNAIPDANIEHIQKVASLIVSKATNKEVNFYRFAMKSGSDNCRESATFKVAKAVHDINPELKLNFYEPNFGNMVPDYLNNINNIDEFTSLKGLFVFNRLDDILKDKLSSDSDRFTLDIYGNN